MKRPGRVQNLWSVFGSLLAFAIQRSRPAISPTWQEISRQPHPCISGPEFYRLYEVPSALAAKHHDERAAGGQSAGSSAVSIW
jgi:hypothetical protein